MSEKYRAEFTVAPTLIGIVPGIIFFTLALSLGFSSLILGFFIGTLPLSILMGLTILAVKRSKAIVYSDAFEFSTTFLTKRVRRIEASKIESVDFRESIIGRSRWGTVTVRGAGLGALRIGNVRNPEKLAEAVRSVASSPNPKNAKSETSTLSTSISELSNLLAKGVITQEEFEKAKAKLLD